MKIVAAAILALALSACSSVKLDQSQVSDEAVKYTQDFGKVEVTFNDKGVSQVHCYIGYSD
jgi:uncharacterized lipoprotein